MPEVPCPFCVLCPLNVQVCGLLVDMRNPKKTQIRSKSTDKQHATITDEAALSLIHLTLSAKEHLKKNGMVMGNHEKEESCTYTIERLYNHVYKVCFHAKRPTHCDPEEDPC
jgi:hypothetical protein